MSGTGESVYNLIPTETYQPPAAPRYVSRHSKTVKADFKRKVGVARVGDSTLIGVKQGVPQVRHSRIKSHATIGEAKTPLRKPTNFLRAHEKEPVVAPPSPYNYPDGRGRTGPLRRPPVPAPSDSPKLGTVTTKNFVTANAVEAILAVPPAPRDAGAVRYSTKPEYGRVPEYLETVKAEVDAEYRYVAGMQDAGVPRPAASVSLLDPAEIDELRTGLQAKWDALNARYQKIIHADTIQQVARKEALEAEMDAVEADLAALSAEFVFVQ
ncbi:enkurin [Thecamonas trahens ATCC 50062]|uniref:Enkurin n=1 Tax=Thecamonas trahens ATCC 50062 TaxID=461836 RepID=A0A0L0D798_THETB|nr:enkurin [Thecamonas trahens ATCC 50062]KNC48224.1 enkurin [Thecamonas trahens ATCC 50062]|eukprot:XP_013758793.1 enkurin [Thecamonas trahens ATCC 50062]